MNARTLAKCNQGSGYRRPAVHRYNRSQRQCRTPRKKTAEGKARAQFVLRADQISDDLLSLNQKGRASSPTASAPLSVALPRPASNRGARYASSNCFSAPLIYVSRTEISCTSPQCGHLTLSVAFQAARRPSRKCPACVPLNTACCSRPVYPYIVVRRKLWKAHGISKLESTF